MKYVKFLTDINANNKKLVGTKNNHLAEMIQELSSKEINVPMGFVTIQEAYLRFLKYNDLYEKLKNIYKKLRSNLNNLDEIAYQMRQVINLANFPDDLTKEIDFSYMKLSKYYNVENVDTAVRSSVITSSKIVFLGQQESFLNVHGIKKILSSIKSCIASLFTHRSIAYLLENDIDPLKTAISVCVQKMVRSDKACSGTIFTKDVKTDFKNVIIINSAYGLGQNITQGLVNTDEFHIHKQTLEQGFQPIIRKTVGTKKLKLIYKLNSGGLKNIKVNLYDQNKFSLNDNEILELSRNAITIEKYYSTKHNWDGVNIEWAKDGLNNKIYIVEAEPILTHPEQNQTIKIYNLKDKPDQPIASGIAITDKIAIGKAKKIFSLSDKNKFKNGEILVTQNLTPDWLSIIKKAAGIITESGGRTSHAAIISQELGIPAIIGVKNKFNLIKEGQELTIDCSTGPEGYVYGETLKFSVEDFLLASLPKAPVDLKLNIAEPNKAYANSFLPVTGVGLSRMEFIYANIIGVHPLAITQPEQISKKIQAQINKISIPYKNAKEFFIETLSQSIGTIAAGFYPKEVIVRLSDLKSNEYRNLLGGSYFEPEEENPMLGLRGTSRHCNIEYKETFELEYSAIKKARDVMGFKNINLLIPFVRTIEEAKAILKILETNGLKKQKDLKIYMMCEIPSNILNLEQFQEHFDGFSLGSNDLTQLILATDRDSALVSSLFNENDPAVKKAFELAIEQSKKFKKSIGSCGQAPANYKEIADLMIEKKIDYISLDANSIPSFLLKFKR